MYTAALLCFIILASPLVQSLQISFTQNGTYPAMGNTNSTGPSNPEPREGSCLQIKTDGSGLYMFGGLTTSGTAHTLAPANLWTYTFANSSWNLLLNASVTPRPAGRESMSCWLQGNQLVIYGGDTDVSITAATIYSDQYVYSPSAWNAPNVTTPGPLSEAATWRSASTTYVYGGYNASSGTTTGAIKTYSTSWAIKTAGTTTVAYTGSNINPGSRSRMAFATAASTVGWMFGGSRNTSVFYGDLWSYTFSTGKWAYVSGKTSVNIITTNDNMPPCMVSSVMAITSLGNIILYGGIQANGVASTSLWKYSVTAQVWTLFSAAVTTFSGPAPSSFIAYTPDMAGGAYLFGGNSTAGSLTNALYHLNFAECPAGYFVNSSGVCTGCPAGTYQGKNTEVCTKCAAGTFNNAPGLSGSRCQPCPQGTFASSTGATVCIPCGLGLATAGTGSPSCSKCTQTVGQYALNGTCTPCPAGTYLTTTGNATCLPCPPGTYSNKTGQMSCSSNCPAGTFSNAGATSCYTCPLGTASSGTGSLGCVPCSPGTSSTIGGKSYGNTSVSTCNGCAPGYFANTYGAVSCDPCPVGTSSSLSQSTCLLCPPGSHASASSANTQCVPCPVFAITTTYINQYCNFCPYGSIPNKEHTTCTYCPVGTYHDGTNMDQCTLRDESDNLRPCCSPCPVGTFIDTQGAIKCLPCAPGFVTDTKGSAYCLPCPLNTRSFNGTTCISCPSNTYSPGGSQWCSPTGY